ncbi:MAG: enoyl-CoA hydratase/isomerase family protein [Arenibacterium sp.]
MIELDKKGAVWTITLNRPEKANSLTEAMLERLIEIVREGRDLRALILTAKGKVFSAGADLEEVQSKNLALSGLWEELSGEISDLPGLSVAALNGTLAGGAMGMALACDLRIAVPGARFFYPVLKRGVLPQPSDPRRMAALIGPARTKLILMAGQKISADEAYSFGLVDRIVEPDMLLSEAESLLEDACSADAEIVSGISRLCR